MRSIHSLAQALEEMSREEDHGAGAASSKPWYSHCTLCLSSSVADQFVGPIRAICYSPVITLVVVLVVYLAFLIVFCPLWLLSFFITVYGSCAVFCILFHFLAVFITRSIAFPGSMVSTQQQVSAEVVKRVATFLEQIAKSTNEACALLMLVFTGQLAVAELANIQRELVNIWASLQYLPNLLFGVAQAVDYLKKERLLNEQELINTTQLVKGMEDFSSTLQALLSALTSNDLSKLQDRGFVSRLGRELPFRAHELASTAGKCLAASEVLRISANNVQPKAAEDDGDLLAMVRPLLTSKITGYNQLAFPFMRALLMRNYGAKIVHVKGSGDNGIDCVYFSSAEASRLKVAKAAGMDLSAPSNHTPAVGNKMVFYCGPNAGFFETLAQMDIESSWLGYYLSRGVDFFAFNYRGYGRSTGSPTPSAIKADALKVFEYATKEYRPRSVLVHGESIGGMVAAHVAAHCNVTGLVCDRTFGSLDAAARRILAQWAGGAVKYAAWWSTNVVDDYLSVKCAKLILQDPQDEIIAHAASLKCGLAARLVLHDASLAIPYEPSVYAYARFAQDGIPYEQQSTQWLEAAGSPQVDLPRDFIVHLYACCGAVAAKYDESKPKETGTNSNSAEKHQRIADEVSGGGEDPGRAPGTENMVAESGMRMLAARLNRSGPAGQPMHGAKVVSNVRLYQMNLEESITVNGRSLGAYAKAWLAIGRIKGAAGQLLNHALCRGMDETVAWACSYVVWLDDNGPDSIPAGGTGSIARALMDLQALTTVLHPVELGSDVALQYVIKALSCLESRRQQFHKRAEDFGGDVETATAGGNAGGCGAKVCGTSSRPAVHKEDAALGDLVSFSCGHNGWPVAAELDQVTAWLGSRTTIMS